MASQREETEPIAAEHVWALARLAGVPLEPGRAEVLAAALEGDMRVIRRLRGVDAGERHPAGVAPLPTGDDDAGR